MTSASRPANAPFSSPVSDEEDVFLSAAVYFSGIVSFISFSVWNLPEKLKVKYVVSADFLRLKEDGLIWWEILIFERTRNFADETCCLWSLRLENKITDKKWDIEIELKGDEEGGQTRCSFLGVIEIQKWKMDWKKTCQRVIAFVFPRDIFEHVQKS